MNRLKQYICDFAKRIIFGKQSLNRIEYTKYLKNQGVRFGNNLYIADSQKIEIDMTRPWLIEMGDDVSITDNVRILTHDFSYSVVAKMYPGEVYPQLGKVTIGNNVFLGSHSIILPGSTIGNNVIVGAGSVVKGFIPDNCVVAGSPASVICSIDEYRVKLKERYKKNLKLMADEYEKVYGEYIPSSLLTEYYNLYKSSDEIKNTYYRLYEMMRLENWVNNPEFLDLEDMCNHLSIHVSKDS